MHIQNKGQGALEYLLLIGGAIVVAVIVVTLLLGVGTGGSASTQNQTAIGFCKNEAATFNPTTPNCAFDPDGGTATTNEVWVDRCYACAGTYPNCTAVANTDTQANCI